MTADDDLMDPSKPRQIPQGRPDETSPGSDLPAAADDMSRQQYVNVTDMIRSLQRTEGLSDCFRRGLADCDQRECAWREYCIEESEHLQTSNKP